MFERCNYGQVKPKEMRMSFPTTPGEMPIFTPCDGYGSCYSETTGCGMGECKINEACTGTPEGVILQRLEDISARLSDKLSIQRGINATLDEKLHGNYGMENSCVQEPMPSRDINTLTNKISEQLGLLNKLQGETMEFVNYL